MKKLAFALGLAVVVAGCALTPKELPTQSGVDLNEYMGTWHEQARLPNRFQRECVGDVQADYALNPDGTIKVINQCRKGDGSVKQAEGLGRLAEQGPEGDTARLEIRFAPKWTGWLPMVWGDYWIIRLADDDQYSLVGTPDRKYLWVLSRNEQADPQQVTELLDYAGTLGFAVEDVIRRP